MEHERILKSMIGREIMVHSGQNSFTDKGTLAAADDQVIVIHKGSEVMVFPIVSIRLIKVLN